MPARPRGRAGTYTWIIEALKRSGGTLGCYVIAPIVDYFLEVGRNVIARSEILCIRLSVTQEADSIASSVASVSKADSSSTFGHCRDSSLKKTAIDSRPICFLLATASFAPSSIAITCFPKWFGHFLPPL